MAYIDLQGAIERLRRHPQTNPWIQYLKDYINGLDDAYYESNWYKPYDGSGFTTNNGWGAFLYQLTLRAPMILVGNTLAAPLNIITVLINSFSEAHWQKKPLESLAAFIKQGIILNLYENIGSFIIVLFGALISPFKAMIKASLNVSGWFASTPKNPPPPPINSSLAILEKAHEAIANQNNRVQFSNHPPITTRNLDGTNSRRRGSHQSATSNLPTELNTDVSVALK